ncbi:hypothetical protein RNJ44_02220 [Nakaseomyces bracarensis]|uniref:Uncharacterized protein n=1 Tax=Nakaseomyces bracarensis TaxID=273131 RepID=A0ABR4NMT9_9SACH
MASVGGNKDSSISKAYDLTATPIPAIVNGLALLTTPAVSPQISGNAQMTSPASSAKGIVKNILTSSKNTTKAVGPSAKAAWLFGGAQLLGAYMINDGDLENGAGFITAWSALYLIVSGKGSISALKYGKIWPFVLSTMAIGNTALYGKRFLTSDFNK